MLSRVPRGSLVPKKCYTHVGKVDSCCSGERVSAIQSDPKIT